MEKNKSFKNLKLIVFDLDGTLLADDSNIGSDTKKIINELHNYDVHFTFASGRLHSALTAFASELKIDTPLISLDGSLIKSFPEGKVIFESFVKERYVLKSIDYADKFFLNVALCHADAIYYTESNSVIPMIMDKFGAKYEEVPSYEKFSANTLEVVFAGDNKDSIKYLLERLNFPYSFGLTTSYFKSLRHKGIYYLEVRKKGTSKGKGMLRLLKYLKLKPHEAAVVGDWYNDISLFKTSAFKVALANAVPEIKRMANLITEKNNNEDGVAEFLEQVLKAKKDK
jgi:Cof subfamily protein (haloacid dehalogenase superfamily)